MKKKKIVMEIELLVDKDVGINEAKRELRERANSIHAASSIDRDGNWRNDNWFRVRKINKTTVIEEANNDTTGN